MLSCSCTRLELLPWTNLLQKKKKNPDHYFLSCCCRTLINNFWPITIQNPPVLFISEPKRSKSMTRLKSSSCVYQLQTLGGEVSRISEQAVFKQPESWWNRDGPAGDEGTPPERHPQQRLRRERCWSALPDGFSSDSSCCIGISVRDGKIPFGSSDY